MLKVKAGTEQSHHLTECTARCEHYEVIIERVSVVAHGESIAYWWWSVGDVIYSISPGVYCNRERVSEGRKFNGSYTRMLKKCPNVRCPRAIGCQITLQGYR